LTSLISTSSIQGVQFPYTGSAQITGSLAVTGSVSVNGPTINITSGSLSGSFVSNVTDIYTTVAPANYIVTIDSASYGNLLSTNATDPNTLYVVTGSIAPSGTSGTAGTSGTSGVNGAAGSSGTSGTSGTSGINGVAGSSGTSGTSGVSGTHGSGGTSGTSGTSGSSGTSGLTTILTVADEGTAQGTATFINFIGSGVTATVTSNTASITVSSGGGATFPYTGSAIISGSLIITGSSVGNIVSASLVSGSVNSTASIDCNAGNFFTCLALGNNQYNIFNAQPGEVVTLRLQTVGIPTASFSSNVKQISGSAYLPTSGSGQYDLLTLVAYDSSNVYLLPAKKFI